MFDDSEPDDPAIPAFDPARVARELARLPFIEREALLLKSRDGLTYAEIGALLGLSEQGVEACVAAALAALHARLTRKRMHWWRSSRPLPWPLPWPASE